MELKDIQELIKMVKKADISGLKISEGDFTVTIKNKGTESTVVYNTQPQMPMMQQQPMMTNVPGVQTPGAQQTPATESAAAPAANNENNFTFRSPMVGTFYRKPGIDKEVFVKVGDNVKTGDVLCIIEAMKLFNEIEFDGVEGKIIKILIEDSSPVEYDQPLFLIEKS
ncbi:MAG: acetyl-CoA carboxylase biotin carboxyl carrier protein [Bacteroidetes bacterium]|nr:acetyl-CoA carboxylase biotin carboxyl carrier protein [Bacteroidota bacterium]